MGKALGIAAFVILLVSVPIPIVGNYVTFLALALATAAALGGERLWTMVVVIISAIKLFFLSPTWHLLLFPPHFQNPMAVLQAQQESLYQASVNSSHTFWLITLLFLGAPVAALLFRGMVAPETPVAPQESLRDSNPMKSSFDEDQDTANRTAPLPSASALPMATSQASHAGANDDQDTAFWDSVSDKNDVDHLEEYLIRFPHGRFAQLARNRLERKGVVAPAPFEVPASPSPIATEAQTTLQPPQTWCAACGVALEPDSKFCADCGEPAPA